MLRSPIYNSEDWVKLMELKWLKDFIALVEHGSFSKASEARFVTQPAFSRRIRSLENWLGSSLVDRDHYPTTLTAAGEAFAEQAQQLINQIYASRNHIRDISLAQEQLTIVSQHALAVAFFPTWMQKLQTLAGDALIRVDAGNLHDTVESFLSGNGDFLLSYASSDIFNQLEKGEIDSLQVGVDKLVPVTSVDANGNARHSIDLDKSLKLLTHPPESFFGRLIQRECLPHLPKELKQHTICENALSEALKALVLQGHGIAWLPQSLISKELSDEQLRILEFPLYSVVLSIKLYRLSLPRSEAAEHFWEHLLTVYDA